MNITMHLSETRYVEMPTTILCEEVYKRGKGGLEVRYLKKKIFNYFKIKLL